MGKSFSILKYPYMKNCVEFYVNGKFYKAFGRDAFNRLSDFLRQNLFLTGTKEVCCEGNCGACTVLIGKITNEEISYLNVNSCILYVYQNELFLTLMLSTEACAEILSIETNDALHLPEVAAILSYKDIPGHNIFGSVIEDQYILAEKTVQYYGQPVLIIAAKNRESALKAKKLIKIKYRRLKPVLSIEEALNKSAFIGIERSVERGDIREAFKLAENVFEGQFFSGGQEHFYFEPQSALVIPEENDCVKVLSSTQNPTEVQQIVATVLRIPFNHVVVETRRLGGAFGGKESQGTPFAAMAALVAQKTKKPARLILDRETDMLCTGKRHPFFTKHKTAFDNKGIIIGHETNLFADGGYAADLSTSILERAVLHSENAYFIPNIRIKGITCRTSYAPNTAFRGFGAPQAILAMESIIEDIASYLRVDAIEVRKANLYGTENNNTTPYDQIFENNTLPRLFERIEKESDYKNRVNLIRKFNSKQNEKTRGISCSPLKFGISFTTKHLNQANSFVNIYLDGTVQVSTGGVEMGQGLNTKIIQIVADEFRISTDKIRIMVTSTEKNNNMSPTAASSGTDLNGFATINACKKLKHRLAEFGGEGVTFEQMVKKAYLNRVSLGERGFYATPKIEFDWETGKGSPFYYFTCGCAVSEVEIDRYTGETTLIRTDILMDIGNSINPGLDRGQIAGGFVQAVGWLTLEDLIYSQEGMLLTASASTYKIPSIHDLPKIFNISFLENNENTKNIAGSKAVGEPPFMMGISVFCAIKNALAYIDKDVSIQLSAPATAEKILSLLLSHAK